MDIQFYSNVSGASNGLLQSRLKLERCTPHKGVHPALGLGLISITSLGPKASTKVESHVNFNESQKVSQPIFFFCNVNHKEIS